MNKTILLLLLGATLFMSACSGGKVEKIPLEIPHELQGNGEAEALIADMTDAVNDCRTATVKLARVAVKNESDSLNRAQTLKMGVIAIGFAKAQGKMADCIRQAENMGENLTEAQHNSLMACLKKLENRSTEIDDNPEALGMTQEELAEKAGTKKSYISKIENAKGNIQLSTLIRIFEKGLNRKIGLTFL